MERCWSVGPTSDRIVQEISYFRRILATIVEAKGRVVHGEAFRYGHRSLRLDDEGSGPARVKPYQRKKCFLGRPVNSNALSYYNRLVSAGGL